MFCICCLEESDFYINLNNCFHGDYLENFSIPMLNPPLERTICSQCHTTLKKINLFKLQVEESFSLLTKQGHKIETRNHKKQSIAVSKVVNLNILDEEPNIETTDAKKDDSKIKNIETALEIINNNSTSLQTLAVCNLQTIITDTILKATTGNLNLKTLASPHKNEVDRNEFRDQNNEILKEVFNSDVVLPVNIKNDADSKVIQHTDNITILKGYDANYLYSNNQKSVDNGNILRVKEEEYSGINIFHDEPLGMPEIYNNITIMTHKAKDLNNDNQTPVLPAKIKNKSDADVVVGDAYGTAVLPDIKSEPDNGNHIVCKRVSVIQDPSEPSRNDNTSAAQNAIPSLLKIRLTKEELLKERSEKLSSIEFYKWSYRCDLCIIGFNYKPNLDDHNKRKHTMKTGCVNCDICKQVVLEDEIKYHTKRHYNRLQCSICNERFVILDEAVEHFLHKHQMDQTDNISIIRNDKKGKKRQRMEDGKEIPNKQSKQKQVTPVECTKS